MAFSPRYNDRLKLDPPALDHLVSRRLATMALSPRYYDRLKLDPATLDSAPSLSKLQRIQEAHLAQIPFENSAQHGTIGGPAVLNVAATAVKILDRKRGGFCYELNGLLADFLEELGYGVTRVLAFVNSDQGFREVATHMFLVVYCLPDTTDESMHYVDVGFGEPPIHPLRYDEKHFGAEQRTPEGMRSKISRPESDDSEDIVICEWYRSGQWIPRLRWSLRDSKLRSSGPKADDLSRSLAWVQEESSIFSLKLIACILTRDKKITLAGNQLKITGPPRFADNDDAVVSIQHLDSVKEVRDAMSEIFDIPLAESEGLDLAKSLSADPSVWSHQ
jgi:N-hydroxyarylamine O-acetyltransferase